MTSIDFEPDQCPWGLLERNYQKFWKKVLFFIQNSWKSIIRTKNTKQSKEIHRISKKMKSFLSQCMLVYNLCRLRRKSKSIRRTIHFLALKKWFLRNCPWVYTQECPWWGLKFDISSSYSSQSDISSHHNDASLWRKSVLGYT